jgi:alanine racemase
MYRPLWIEIDLGALRDNFRAIKLCVGRNVKIIATVKQQAYGHGLLAIAGELSRLGVDSLGVGSIEEALLLRENGFIEPILTLSAVLPSFSEEILHYNITPMVADLTLAKALNKAASHYDTKINIHVKVDTGMGRMGLYYKDAYKLMLQLKKFKHIALDGLYTHFPAADTDPDFTNFQIDIFNKFISKLKNEGIFFKYTHCANSLGIAQYPHSHFSAVRPGLILYGIKPSPVMPIKLKPVLSLKSKVIFIKKVKKGMSVSYGRTFIAAKPINLATVSVGYADGYPWSLSNRAKIIIRGALFDIAGRVCMDHIMVNLEKHDGIKVGDEAVLIGRSRNANISAEDVADWAKTIPYEIVSRLSLKIPRFYKNSSDKQLLQTNS